MAVGGEGEGTHLFQGAWLLEHVLKTVREDSCRGTMKSSEMQKAGKEPTQQFSGLNLAIWCVPVLIIWQRIGQADRLLACSCLNIVLICSRREK